MGVLEFTRATTISPNVVVSFVVQAEGAQDLVAFGCMTLVSRSNIRLRDLGFPGLAELAAEAGANGAHDDRRLTGRRANRGAALALRRGGEDGRGADSRWTLRLRRLPVRRLRLQPLALAGEHGQAHRDDLGRRRDRAAQALRDSRARPILLFRFRAPARGVRLEAARADPGPPAARKRFRIV